MQKGEWVVIENANFCNPTVLDRLNPLVENNGELMVNERGVIDGQVKVIKPHPEFRLFLTMDSKNGEISRAMRNRGVEIYVLDSELNSRDTILMLNGIGIIGQELPQAMIDFHNSIAALRLADRALNLRDLMHWASLTVAQLQRGFTLRDSLRLGMNQVYIRNSRTKKNQQAIAESYEKNFELWFNNNISSLIFAEAGLWPDISALATGSYSQDSRYATIKRQGALLGFLISKEISALFAGDLPSTGFNPRSVLAKVESKAFVFTYSMLQHCFGRFVDLHYDDLIEGLTCSFLAEETLCWLSRTSRPKLTTRSSLTTSISLVDTL